MKGFASILMNYLAFLTKCYNINKKLVRALNCCKTRLMFQNSVLSIKFDYQKSVQLIWDFRGALKNDVFYRHVLISQSSQSQFFHSFCEQYYMIVKSGDLICSVTPYDKQTKLKWNQKMPHSSYEKFKRKYDPSKNLTLSQLLELISNQTSQFSEPLFVNIVYDYKPNRQKIKNLIDQCRSQGSLKFVINIFANIQNEVNLGDGINYLSSERQNLKASLNFAKWYFNNLSALRVQIELECLNGNFNVQSKVNWKNIDFNRIQKSYVGFIAHRYIEQLFFIENSKVQGSSYAMNIKIRYTLLNGQKFESSKKLWVDCQKFRSNMRTCNQHLQLHFQLSPGFTIKKNPYENQVYIWIERDKTQVRDTNRKLN